MDFDYVIVGGGSAGCVLAGRLSADPTARVCLIEAGPDDDHVLCRVPFATAVFVPGKWRNWAFHTVPQAGLDGRRGYQPRGRMLGGSSGINAMIYIRGHPSDYDDWAAQGATGWSFADVLPYFKRAEGNERLGGTLHGTDGPLNVADLVSPNPLNDTFLEACEELQLPRNRDFNGAVPGRRRPLPGDAEGRRALERGARLPAARGAQAAEPAHRHRGAGAASALLGAARDRRRLPPRRQANRRGDDRRPPRRHPVGGRLPVAAAPDAVGHRPAGRARPPRHRGPARPAGRRPQPAGSHRLHAELHGGEPAPVRLHPAGPGAAAARDPALAARAAAGCSRPTLPSPAAS